MNGGTARLAGRLAWATVALGLVGVAVLVGRVVTTNDRRGPEPAPRTEGVIAARAADSFDRPDHPSSLRGAPGGLPWRPEAGVWGVMGNQAGVSGPARGRSLAVVTLERADAEVQVRLAKVVNDAGLVFRYQDRRNYWSVVAVPAYATWAITKTVDGKRESVANTGYSAVQDGTTVSVRLRGESIDVAVNGEVRKTISDGALARARRVGMTAGEPGGRDARFDDFQVTLGPA